MCKEGHYGWPWLSVSVAQPILTAYFGSDYITTPGGKATNS
jgi:hypothetical protein